MALTAEDLKQIAEMNAAVIAKQLLLQFRVKKTSSTHRKNLQALEMAQQARAAGAAGIMRKWQMSVQRNVLAHEHSAEGRWWYSLCVDQRRRPTFTGLCLLSTV
jgi:hypothetical protein